MADEPVKLLVLLGPNPLREWEKRAVDAVSAIAGVAVTVAHAAREEKDRHRAMGSALFRRYVNSSAGMLADAAPGSWQVAEAADAATADAILLLAGAEEGHAAPRHGIWRFITEEGEDPDRLPPGISAAIRGRTSVHFHLVDMALDRSLRTGCFPVVNKEPQRTASIVLEHAAQWPAMVARELAQDGAAHAHGHVPEPLPADPPGNLTMLLHHMGRMIGSAGVREETAADGVFGDWNIGLLHQPIHMLLREEASMNVRWFPSPGKGKGRVEPFGYLADDGEMNVLYRKTDNAERSGSIARLRPKPDNILKRSRTMLHLGADHGYPYTLTIEGRIWALRTDAVNDRTEVLRVNDTNDGMDEAVQLLPRALFAPTLFMHDGRWWLMGTRDPLPDAELHIFHSASPFGPFIAHAQNPVKCDVRSSRPAGTPFMHDGTLWRPALDASIPDAYAVVLNKVTELTPDRFNEESHRRIEGFPSTAYGRGVRTVCAMGDLTLVDGLRSPVVEGSRANGSRSKRRRHHHKPEHGS